MRAGWIIAVALTVALAGCAAGGAASHAKNPPAGAAAPEETPAAVMPLLVDRTDLRIGTTVYFSRLPTDGDLNDLRLVSGVTHVVVVLNRWPTDPTLVEPLGRIPGEADAVVILAGYPPSRAAAELWNYIGDPRVAMLLLVTGPPADRVLIDDLNAMRHLDRVIVEMDDPSRSGFERLQRPLSFRKVVR